MSVSRKQLNFKRIYINKKNNVMKKKLYLESPQAELIIVRFEENIMSPNYNQDYHTEYLDPEEDGGNL